MQTISVNSKINIDSSYDTVVCGGGIAGISAALAAARHGAKTLLIEREFMLGGLATAGLIAIYLQISDGYGHQVSFGIAEELLKLSAKHGYLFYANQDGEETTEVYNEPLPDMKHRLKVYYDPNVYAIDCEKLLIKEGVKILYGTQVTDTVVENNRITHIITENRDGKTAFSGKTFVDATGDAVLTHLSGEKTEEYKLGNIMAGWYYKYFNDEFELIQLGFSDDKLLDDEAKKSKKTISYSANDITDFTINSHDNSLRDFLKDGNVNSKHCMASISTIPQLRMTRRIDGKYLQDIEENDTSYPDSIGMFVNWHKRRGTVYELPYRCLIGNNISNLIAAGRCISSTDKLWDLTRVIPVCAVSGQAAGTAAAISEDFFKLDVAKLQKELIKDNVKIHLSEIE